MENITIRNYTQEDREVVAKIFMTEYNKAPYNEEWTKESSLDKIEDYSHGCQIFIAEYEKKILGFIIINHFLYDAGLKGWVYEIVVDSEHQNKGIGTLLMNKAEKYFREKNIKSIELFAHNKSHSIRLYSNIGYNKTEYAIWRKELK